MKDCERGCWKQRIGTSLQLSNPLAFERGSDGVEPGGFCGEPGRTGGYGVSKLRWYGRAAGLPALIPATRVKTEAKGSASGGVSLLCNFVHDVAQKFGACGDLTPLPQFGTDLAIQ